MKRKQLLIILAVSISSFLFTRYEFNSQSLTTIIEKTTLEKASKPNGKVTYSFPDKTAFNSIDYQ